MELFERRRKKMGQSWFVSRGHKKETRSHTESTTSAAMMAHQFTQHVHHKYRTLLMLFGHRESYFSKNI